MTHSNIILQAIPNCVILGLYDETYQNVHHHNILGQEFYVKIIRKMLFSPKSKAPFLPEHGILKTVWSVIFIKMVGWLS